MEEATRIDTKSLSVGERIKFLRNKKGMTQKALAEALGIHWRTVANYEQGREPSAARMDDIMRILGDEARGEAKPISVDSYEVFALRVKGDVVYRVTVTTERLERGTTMELGI